MELDQVQTNETSDVIEFDVADFTDDVAQTENTQEEKVEGTTDTSQVDKPTEDPILEVVYNGEKVKLTKEKAIELTQKGLNYDKVSKNLQDLRESKEIQMLNSMATRMGVKPAELLERLNDFQNRTAINSAYQQLKEKNPEAPENLLMEHATYLVERQNQEKTQHEEMLANQEQTNNDEFYSQQISQFQTEFPNVDLANLPNEVIASIQNGETLIAAYRAHEISRLKEELEITKLNNKNSEVSPGSISANQANADEGDMFLAGLNS